MPQQRAVELDAVTDQPLAMVDEQPKVELGPLQVRGREGLQALLQRGAGDVEGVDRIGLAALASALSGLRGQVRRDPQHPLAALDQESLQRSERKWRKAYNWTGALRGLKIHFADRLPD